MEQLKVLNFLEKNKDVLFPNDTYSEDELESALLDAPDLFELSLNGIPFKNPSTVQIIAFFPGSLGVDRFYLGDIGKGILKYFTFGGFGIWWIKDIITAKTRCRTYNCKKILDALNDPSVIAAMQANDAKLQNAVETGKKALPVVKAVFKGLKDIGSTFDVK